MSKVTEALDGPTGFSFPLLHKQQVFGSRHGSALPRLRPGPGSSPSGSLLRGGPGPPPDLLRDGKGRREESQGRLRGSLGSSRSPLLLGTRGFFQFQLTLRKDTVLGPLGPEVLRVFRPPEGRLRSGEKAVEKEFSVLGEHSVLVYVHKVY